METRTIYKPLTVTEGQIPRAEKMAEAVKRMNMVKMFAPYVDRFRRSGIVCRSEAPFGALYDVSGDELKALREFEAEQHALVYMVVRCYAAFGRMDSYMYVSDNKDDWASDRQDLKEGIVFTYTVNYDAPDCSEFGSIGFKMGAGAGPVRTA